MPTSFPFIIQSSDTLDQQSMKYVRSHVTRQSMQKRRLITERDGQKIHTIVSRPASDRRRSAIRSKTSTTTDKKTEEQNEARLTAITHRRRRAVERLKPSSQLSGTTAEFCNLDIPADKLFPLLSNYQEFTSLYNVYSNGRDPGYSPFSGYWKAVAYHNPLWLTSCSLVAFCKIDTLRERSEIEILQYKALALQHLQKAIKDAQNQNDDITIMSLIAFLSFEMLNAETPEDHVAIQGHFGGIETVISMRGGPEEVAKSPIGELTLLALNIYYLIYAIFQNNDPPENCSIPPKIRTDVISFVDEPHYCHSPILKSPPSEDTGYDLRHPQAILPFLNDLNAGWELLFMEYHSAPDSLDYLTYSAYRKQLQMPAEPLAHTTGKVQDDVLAAKLAKSCYLAGLIFYRAIVSFTPFQSPENEPEVTELHVLMKSMDTSTWTLTPYLHLWIVMIGVAASANPSQKRFFGTQLSRSGILFGTRWWTTFNQVICNFIWLQKVIRGEVAPTARLETAESPLRLTLGDPLEKIEDDFSIDPSVLEMENALDAAGAQLWKQFWQHT